MGHDSDDSFGKLGPSHHRSASSNSNLGREIVFSGATHDLEMNSCVPACLGTSSTQAYTADP